MSDQLIEPWARMYAMPSRSCPTASSPTRMFRSRPDRPGALLFAHLPAAATTAA